MWGVFLLDFILVLTGTFIGGGFASGREIGTYFLNYGGKALFGMVLFSVLFFAICFKVCCICRAENINEESDFYNKVFGKKGGEMVFLLTAWFSFMVLCSMLSAMSELGEYCTDIDGIVLRAVFSVAFYIVLIKGISGVKAVNYVLVPVLMAGFLCGGKYFWNGSFSADVSEKTLWSGCIVSSIIYTCYNIITVVPALVVLRQKKGRAVDFAACLIASAVLFVCAFCVSVIICGNFNENMSFSIPVIKAVEGCSYIIKAVMALSVFSAMATTAAAAGCWVTNFFREASRRVKTGAVVLAAFLMSFIDFSVFVDKFYFVFGAAALFEAVKILKY